MFWRAIGGGRLETVRDDLSRFTNRADFYLKVGTDPAFGEPALSLAGNVAEVLFAEGLFAEINSRIELTPGFAPHVGQAVPVNLLPALAAVCRELGERHSDPEVRYEARTVHIRRQVGGRPDRYDLVISATGMEVRTALMDLALIADEAGRQQVEILAVL